MSNKQNSLPPHGAAAISGRGLVSQLSGQPAREGFLTVGESIIAGPRASAVTHQTPWMVAASSGALMHGPSHASYSDMFSTEKKLIVRRISELQSPASPASLPASPQKSLDERLFDATASVKILTSQVAMHLDREWRNKLFAQLDSLHDIEDWDPADEPIRTASFATFLKAVVQIKPQRRPGLGLSNNGQLVASWTVGRDRLTIEFLSNDNVRWVLARSIGDDVERFAGHTSVSRLISSLTPYNPDYWFAK